MCNGHDVGIPTVYHMTYCRKLTSFNQSAFDIQLFVSAFEYFFLPWPDTVSQKSNVLYLKPDLNVFMLRSQTFAYNQLPKIVLILLQSAFTASVIAGLLREL